MKTIEYHLNTSSPSSSRVYDKQDDYEKSTWKEDKLTYEGLWEEGKFTGDGTRFKGKWVKLEEGESQFESEERNE